MVRYDSSTTKRQRAAFQTRLLFSPRRDYCILRSHTDTGTPCPPSPSRYLPSRLGGRKEERSRALCLQPRAFRTQSTWLPRVTPHRVMCLLPAEVKGGKKP